jgi:hypothetical protein
MRNKMSTNIKSIFSKIEMDINNIPNSEDIKNKFSFLPEQIGKVFCYECDNSLITKYHGESLEEHLFACGSICKHYASKFYELYADKLLISEDAFINLCYLTGLYHDLGKPLAKTDLIKTTKKRTLYVGHAQLGVRLLDECLNIEYKEELLWAVNHHMCSCTHLKDIDKTKDNLFPIITSDIIGDKALSYALLSILSIGDHLGRVNTSDEVVHDGEYVFNNACKMFDSLMSYDITKNVENVMTNFRLNVIDKIIINMYGVSGSGKSHHSKVIKDTFQDKYEVIILERDDSMMKKMINHIQKLEN